MKKNSVFLLLACCLLLAAACRKDAKPTASADVADPFARVDNSSSDADHQIFLLYQQSGVPVLYTDTLTRNPLNVLNLGYHLTSLDSFVTAKYLTNSADILTGVDFVKNEILPSLSGNLKPYSILLTDSLTTYLVTYGVRTKLVLNAYLGYNTVAIGGVSAIQGLTPTALTTYKKDVFKSIVTVPLNQDTNVLKAFYAVSAPYYGQYAYGDGTLPGYIAFQPKENYGCFTDGTEYSSFYQMQTQATDLSEYLDRVLTMSAQDFATQYSSYPLVMEKYTLLVNALIGIGFKF